MENKQDYIAKLQVAVSQLYNCEARWLETVPVNLDFQGRTLWKQEVDVFELCGHPTAKRAYAWSHLEGVNDERTRFVAVLEMAQVDSAQNAVRFQHVKGARKQMHKLNEFKKEQDKKFSKAHPPSN